MPYADIHRLVDFFCLVLSAVEKLYFTLIHLSSTVCPLICQLTLWLNGAKSLIWWVSRDWKIFKNSGGGSISSSSISSSSRSRSRRGRWLSSRRSSRSSSSSSSRRRSSSRRGSSGSWGSSSSSGRGSSSSRCLSRFRCCGWNRHAKRWGTGPSVLQWNSSSLDTLRWRYNHCCKQKQTRWIPRTLATHLFA